MDLPFYSRRIKSLQRQSIVIEITKLIIENYYVGMYPLSKSLVAVSGITHVSCVHADANACIGRRAAQEVKPEVKLPTWFSWVEENREAAKFGTRRNTGLIQRQLIANIKIGRKG